jgi:hypothetical protein
MGLHARQYGHRRRKFDDQPSPIRAKSLARYWMHIDGSFVQTFPRFPSTVTQAIKCNLWISWQ